MMLNHRNIRLRTLLVAFFLILAVLLIATLYPFNFFPVNGVQWLSNEPGLYFNGHGIAYTDKVKTVCETKTVSVVLWLKERKAPSVVVRCVRHNADCFEIGATFGQRTQST